MKDMTKREFDAACQRRGFRPAGFMGYYHLPASSGGCMVSVLNAGDRRRDQLAYLIRELEKSEQARGPSRAVNSEAS